MTEVAQTIQVTRKTALARVREAVHASLSRRDRGLPDLAELRNFDVPGPAGPLPLRLYVPKSAGKTSPLLLFFHGGGFLLGDLDSHDALCVRLAHEGGFRVLACSYRLAPEAPFPAQIDDALAAAAWLKRKHRHVGGDRSRLAIGGDSAGGYLAATVAARMPRVFNSQMLIYPLMHLDDEVWASSLISDSRIIGRLAVRYIQSQLLTGDVLAPSLLIDGGLAPLPAVIVAGGPLDPCRPDAIACRDRLIAMGAPVEWRDYPGLIHGFANLTHTSQRSRDAVAEIARLTAEMLNRRRR